MPSVLNDWVHDLTFMQQSVLICAIRNHDGFNKHNPAKDITRYLRRVVLCSAFDGRMLGDPYEEGGGNFTGPLKHNSVYAAVTAFLDGRDEMTLHYWLHAVHAFEIVGYMCPDETIRRHFFDAYHRCISAMHVEPESKYAMEQRLSDNPEKWLARSDAYERAAFHAEQVQRPEVVAAIADKITEACVPADTPNAGEIKSLSDLIPRDGAIYAEVSRKRFDAADEAVKEYEDDVRKLAHDSESQANVAAGNEPFPAWAAVRDGKFVNAHTGNALGHEFDLKWGKWVAEFPKYKPRPAHDERGWQPK
jgi:hypothetical protein